MSAYVVLTAFLFQKGSAESSDPDALAAALPEGANVYFDNVAGAISDRVYPHLATGARVVVCGTAAIEMVAVAVRKDHRLDRPLARLRSEEHTSELQSLMRISYAVFCLKKKKTQIQQTHTYKYEMN